MLEPQELETTVQSVEVSQRDQASGMLAALTDPE